jgi:endogenous inhibitor of DNA gyrase (YacG/DUF329 family)
MTDSIQFRPRCPTCDMLAEPGISDKFLPFCSDRCRLIDLGRWFNEEHQLPCDTQESDSEETPASGSPLLPPGWHDA